MKKFIAFLFAVIMPVAAMAVDSPDVLDDENASLYSQIFMLQAKEKN